jgi:hypothetical protein
LSLLLEVPATVKQVSIGHNDKPFTTLSIDSKRAKYLALHTVINESTRRVVRLFYNRDLESTVVPTYLEHNSSSDLQELWSE